MTPKKDESTQKVETPNQDVETSIEILRQQMDLISDEKQKKILREKINKMKGDI